MNPVIRDLLQNIERLWRALQRQPRNQPGQTTHGSETTVTRETEARQARKQSVHLLRWKKRFQESLAATPGVHKRHLFLLKSHSESDGTPRFLLAYNLSRSTGRGQNPGKKGKKHTKIRFFCERRNFA